MKAYGAGGRVVVATTGLPVPLTPRPPWQAPPSLRSSTPEPPHPVVRCPVCGLIVTGEYIARTGQTRHGPCLNTGRVAR